MASFSFIHVADIHLDSPLRGLQRYEGAPVDEIRGATRRALRNLVELAIAEEADFVLIAGDLYDGDWKDYNTGLFFAAQMGKLQRAGVPVFIVAGNHDAQSRITRQLRMPENVRFLSAAAPETVMVEGCGVAIHGQGFNVPAVTENLAEGYPAPAPDAFNIGLLHTSADGREGHEPYAPCSAGDLLLKGYDYWALGHVHNREVLHEAPWIVFPGNVQGRHARETGPKGCTLVKVEDGAVASAEHRCLDVIRWAVCEVDAAEATSPEEVLDRAVEAFEGQLALRDDQFLAVRVLITGPCAAHRRLTSAPERWVNEIRAVATDMSRGEMWIEKVKLQTRDALDLDEMLDRDDAFGGLLRSLRDLQTDDEALAAMTDQFADLDRKLPSALRTGDDSVDLTAPETLRQALEPARQLILARILSQADGNGP